jgi:hypothetical protein
MVEPSKTKSLSITIRCYALPSEGSPRFEWGRTFAQECPEGTTLRFIIQELLGPRAEVGLVAVNGKLERDWHALLAEGDHVDIFPLMEGG